MILSTLLVHKLLHNSKLSKTICKYIYILYSGCTDKKHFPLSLSKSYHPTWDIIDRKPLSTYLKQWVFITLDNIFEGKQSFIFPTNKDTKNSLFFIFFFLLPGNPENRRWGSFGYIGLLTLLGCSIHTSLKLLG